MLPFAPTYTTVLIAQVCTLQHFFEDVAQGQVAYSLVVFCVHQNGPEEWKNRSYLWFGTCVGIQWLCSYLLPLPQILMSNIYICLAIFPKQFFPVYSIAFLFAFPVFLHLLIYIMENLCKKDELMNTQIYPAGHIEPGETHHQSKTTYIFIMNLIFNIIGYGPKSILAAIDYKSQQSISLYAVLEILPSLCLLLDIGLLYKMNKEVRKKITPVCNC
ncbi:unnamed protein product [Adineta steineri]|uniref:Uncharacterized protein n=1 Tax=Adineta steineri TaxID=433720 RepID=A0A818JFW1_9BILA|nr:unnamed protein product [Adineta steineri]CAF3537835.1 unnamed protein product [Adineta steineri]